MIAATPLASIVGVIARRGTRPASTFRIYTHTHARARKVPDRQKVVQAEWDRVGKVELDRVGKVELDREEKVELDRVGKVQGNERQSERQRLAHRDTSNAARHTATLSPIFSASRPACS